MADTVNLAEFCEALLNISAWDNNTSSPFYTMSPPDEELENAGSLWPPFWMSSNDTNTTLFNKTEIVIRLRTTTEVTVIPILALFGIIFNLILSGLFKSDSYLSRRTYALFQFLLLVEIFYLCSVIVLVSFRQSELDWDLDIMSYITLAMSIFQFMVHWTFYFLQKDVIRSLKGTWYPRKTPNCRNHSYEILLLTVITLILHLPYVPYIRIQMHILHSIFNPCTVPLEDIWDMHAASKTTDWYYTLYFFIFYFLSVYALPFFLVGCIDKDIVDILFMLKDKTNLPMHTIRAAHSVKAVGILSNIYLVCLTNKAIIIGFRIVHFFCVVFRGIHIFFYFMNFIGNMTLVVRPAFNLIVFVMYTKRYQQRLNLAQKYSSKPDVV